ncbi:DUF6491 family protein [Sphingomonas gilva]|nr:DUF6491 family protein [Sphingomonas gilva]
MIRALLLLAPIALAGCASDRYAERQRAHDETKLARLLGDRVPGEPQSCLDSRMTNGSEPVGSQTILYFQGSTVYRNDLIGQCSGLRSDDIPVITSHSGRLCRGDMIRTVSRGAPNVTTGGCALGDFVPYRER